MTRNNETARAVRRALIASAVAATAVTTAAQAQDQAAQDLSTVTITGSRIQSPNLQSISPVTAITAEALSQTGKVRIEDIINQLPQAFAAQGSNIANGSDGTATVDLRNLGDRRTLVLVNGRRMMPGDPDGGSAADLNNIPLALVKRVDVLTGGASSVYGADAVAGVVNFMLDTEFQGLKLETNYSFNQHHNDNNVGQIVRNRGFATPKSNVSTGYTRDVTLALGIGGEDQSGHATLYATYRKTDAVLESQLDYSACTLNNTATGFACGGSQTTDPAAFFAIDPAGDFLDNANCSPDVGCILGAGGTLRVFNPATDVYNFGPLNYFQRPDERYTLGGFIDYDLSDSAKAYSEIMFMDDRSVAQIAPSGSFFGEYFINCDNPLFGAGTRQVFCDDQGLGPNDSTHLLIGRRNTEGGGRQDDIGHEAYRAVLGVKGDVGDIWNYDVSFQHGVTRRNSTYLNDFSIVRTGRALQARIDDRLDGDGNPLNADTFGTPQCLAFLDGTDTNCVPWNIWQQGGVTPEALAYLQTPGIIRAQATQRVGHADMTGDFSENVKLPTAEGGLQVNFGVEWRSERTEFRPDSQFETGDLAGQGGATLPVGGGFTVREGFFEARMPLVEGKTAAQSIDFETGYRYSDYSLGFNTDTYKFGLNWSPVEQLRFRGSFQHAVRAPNIGELFSSASVALDGSSDPCAGSSPDATQAECVLTGLPASQYGNTPENPAGQYNGLLGGNPTVLPETSDTTSFGLVWRPAFANATLAIDYFDIKIEDTISSTVGGNADAIINNCIAGAQNLCDSIHRDSLGSLWLTTAGYIDDLSRNLGTLRTKGVDIQATYGLTLGDHKLGFNLVGTYLDELTQSLLPGLPAFDCKGLYGNQCGVPSPEWRHSLRATWTTPWRGLDLGLTWRYLGSVDSERTSSDPQLTGLFGAGDKTLSSRSYVDMNAAIKFADHYTFRLGANNLLDKDPPIVGSGTARGNCPAGPCNGNTYAQMYDVLGRQWFAQVAVDF